MPNTIISSNKEEKSSINALTKRNPSEYTQAERSALASAYFSIVQCVGTLQTALRLQAKQLNANANAQIKENNEVANVKYYNVPKPQYSYYLHYSLNDEYQFWHASFWCKTDVHWAKGAEKNGAQVAIAEMANQQQSAIRQSIENKLTALQQTEQVSTTKVDTQTNFSVSAMEEATRFLSLLKQLTNKIYGIRLNN